MKVIVAATEAISLFHRGKESIVQGGNKIDRRYER